MRAASAFLSALLLGGCAVAQPKTVARTVHSAAVLCGETILGTVRGTGKGVVAGAYFGCQGGTPACLPAIGIGAAGGAIIGTMQGFDSGVRRVRDLWREPAGSCPTSDAYL